MKKVWGVGRVFLVFLLLLIVDIVAVALFEVNSLIITVIIGIIGVIIALISLIGLNNNIGKIISGVSKGISTAQSKALSELRVPVLITTAYGEIVWYNPQFEEDVEDASSMVGKSIEDVFSTEFKEEIEMQL